MSDTPSLRDAALRYHEFPRPGKLEIRATKPMANGRDLARAYRMLLERPGLVGHYNVAAQSGVPVQDILREIIKRHRHDGAYVVRNRKHVMKKYGAWAEGPTLDQQIRAQKIYESCGWVPEVSDFTQACF